VSHCEVSELSECEKWEFCFLLKRCYITVNNNGKSS